MEKNEYILSASTMICLIDCVLNGKKADMITWDKVNMDNLFKVCQRHNLTAIAAYGLADVGIKDNNFRQAKEKAIRKNILLDTERKKIAKIFDEKGIWYMPLKGVLLKEWYPKSGMRQMSDNDILIDPTKKKEIREVMTGLGYKYKNEDSVNAYFKEPIYNFEMHIDLFLENAFFFKAGYPYYKDIKTKLIRDDEKSFGYHFSNEDFYIYLNAHEYKHYSGGGTGVRSLVDTYIFLTKYQNELNWDYINKEHEKLGILEYEKMKKNLAMKIFNNGVLTDEEKEQLDFFIFSGTFGTGTNLVDSKIKKLNANSKGSYIFKRIFPPMEHYQACLPWAYKYKILLPVAWLYRIIRMPFIGLGAVKSEIRDLKTKF